MKRLMHRFLNLLALLMLLLCISALVLWPLRWGPFGDFYGFVHVYGSNSDTWQAGTYDGCAFVHHYLADSLTRQPERDKGFSIAHLFGYRYFERRLQRWSSIYMSLWLIAALAAPLPLLRFGPSLLRRLRRPRIAGLCPRCSYDLRATPDRCPECGFVPLT